MHPKRGAGDRAGLLRRHISCSSSLDGQRAVHAALAREKVVATFAVLANPHLVKVRVEAGVEQSH